MVPILVALAVDQNTKKKKKKKRKPPLGISVQLDASGKNNKVEILRGGAGGREGIIIVIKIGERKCTPIPRKKMRLPAATLSTQQTRRTPLFEGENFGPCRRRLRRRQRWRHRLIVGSDRKQP